MAIVLQIIKLFGGLGMFLFGMHTMSTGLERAAGNKMQKIMEKVTGNLLKSVVLGAVVAALTQSSSATTVMVVGFVNAGILNLNQAVGIIMGANIGTTITAWILSLNDIPGGVWYLDLIKPTTLAPLALVFGAFMLLFCKSKKKTVIGEFIIGLGVLFIGMEYMSDSMDVVFNQVPSLQSLFAADSNPFVGVLIGAGVTAIIQSSAASVGMLQAIASTGSLTFNAAFPIIMGQNIGTCVTALLSSIGANRNAKRTAMIHLYFNVIGTVIFMLGFYAIHFTIGLPFWQSVIRATDISIFHSFFNVVTTLMLLPFSRVLVWLANKTLRDHNDQHAEPFALLDARFLSTPPIAISNTKKAMVDMCALAMQNVINCRTMLKKRDLSLVPLCKENEEMLDNYEIRLTSYLTQISELPLSEEDNGRVAGYFHMVTNIERIGDYCDNIRQDIERMVENQVLFTEKARRDLNTLFSAIEDVTRLTFEAFEQCDPILTRRIEPLEEVVDGLQEKLETEHMRRLKAKECNVEAGVIFLEIISNAERISDHCSNIGVAILQAQRDSSVDNRHDYLRELHAEMPGAYKQDYEQFKKKYLLS